MTSKLNLTFGTDPEMFLVEKGTKNLIPPVELRRNKGLLVVDDTDPRHPVFYEDSRITVMEDGALFEFTVTPSKTSGEMFGKVTEAKDVLQDIASYFGLEVLHSPIADFDVARFFENEELDEEQKMCVVAGCDPDEDAIDSEYQSGIVRNLTEWNKRGAGGHVHIGTDSIPELHKIIVPAVQLLATTVGIASAYLSEDTQAEKLRMEVFGRPGRYRPQYYKDGWLGVEYRTPSNSWLLTEEGAELIVRCAEKAMYLLVNTKEGKAQLKKFLEPSINAILKVDKELSKELLTEQKLI